MAKIRTTISVEPEVLQVYRDMAESSGMSLSACIGGWLESTHEAALLITNEVNKSKSLPSGFLNALLLVNDDSNKLMKDLVDIMSDPSSNTGLKSSK